MSARLTSWGSLIALVRQAGPALHAQRAVIGLAFVALFTESALRLLEPWPLQYLIDNIVLASLEAGLPMNLTAAALACACLTLIIALRALVAYGWTMGFAIAGNRVLLHIRAKVFQHLQLLSLRFHGASRLGDLLTRLIDDVGMVRDVVVTAAMPLVGSLVLLIAMLSVMAWLNWRLTLIAIIGAPLLIFIFTRSSHRIHRAAKQQRQQVSKVAATAAESLASIKAIQALGMGQSIASEFSSANNADLTSGVKVKRLSVRLERTVDVVIGIITATTLFFGVMEIFYERLSVGELLVFLAYLRATAKPTRNWAKFTARISKSAAGAQRILELLLTDPEISEPQQPVSVNNVAGKLQFKSVSFHFGDVQIVAEANFVIHPGETVAVVGPSGAGKSTLLSLCMRLYDPTTGTIELDGYDLKTIPLQTLRQQFAVSLQDALLFQGTFRENLTQGRPVSEEQLTRIASQTRVTDIVEDFEQHLDAQIQEHGANLSNGEKQRISLARALLSEAPILIVDEPLTGLDPLTAQALDQAINLAGRDRTFIYVTHDHQQACRADRVLYLAAGRLRDLGPCSLEELDRHAQNLTSRYEHV